MALFGGKARDDLEPSEAEIRSLLLREWEESEADWLWFTDANRRIIKPGARLSAATGVASSALEGTPILQVLAGPTWENGNFAQGLRLLADKLKNRETFRDLRLPVYVRGEERWWELSGAPRFKGGQFIGFFGVASDVTVQRAMADRINRLARYDSLTGLPNRLFAEETIDRLISEGKRRNKPTTIAVIAITNLNDVKVASGYAETQLLLRRLANVLSEGVDPQNVIIGHVAPGEFVIVQRAIHSENDPSRFLAGLVDVADATFGTGSAAALGWAEAECPTDGDTGADLVSIGLERAYSAARSLRERRGRGRKRGSSKAEEAEAATRVDAGHRQAILTYGPQAQAGLRILVEEQRHRLHNGPPEALNSAELEQMETLYSELQNLILLASEGAPIERKTSLVRSLVRGVFRFSQDTGELFVAGLKPFLASAPLALGTLVLLQAVCTPAVGTLLAPGAALAVLAGHYGLDLRRAKKRHDSSPE